MKFGAYLKLLRPSNWLKNLMLLFPPFLGGTLLQTGMLRQAILPLVTFCLASSSVYVFNDMLDAKNDSHHPRKKHRPIASGLVSRLTAAVIGAIALTLAVFLALQNSKLFLLFLLLYLVITILYSWKLKNFPIIDIFCLSAGFVLRLQAGGAAFNVRISEWLFLSVFLLAIFLGTGKRLSEKRMLDGEAGNHRRSLLHYPDGFLEGAMYMTGATVLVTYTMYVIQRPALVYSVPVCTFGLFRYMMLVKSHKFGDPTEALLKDGGLFAVGMIWAAMIGWGTYVKF